MADVVVGGIVVVVTLLMIAAAVSDLVVVTVVAHTAQLAVMAKVEMVSTTVIVIHLDNRLHRTLAAMVHEFFQWVMDKLLFFFFLEPVVELRRYSRGLGQL